jgi:2-desacetyl-2-hydroxyethyl bacteriochlorophyllide A dehydrogenase
MSTMQAVLFKDERQVAVEEVPRPEILEPNDVILKVTKTMICGTDLHFYHGVVPLDQDFVLGHEYLGEVLEVGDGVVDDFDVGDVCVGSFMAVCGKCWFCRRGNYAQCFNVRVFGMGMAFGDVPGGQAQYIRIPDAALTLRKVPEGVDEESAAFLGDIFTTGYDAIMRADFRHGDSVAIIGAGPVGLCTLLAAKAMGAGPVVVVDMVESRLKLVQEHGGIPVNAKTGDPEEVVKDATEWRGADIVVDAVGHPAALASTVPLVRMGGQISIPGVYLDDDQVFPNFNEAYLKGVRITMGIGDIQGQIDSAMALIRDRGADPGALISHRMRLSEAAEGYKIFDEKEAFKVVLDPEA